MFARAKGCEATRAPRVRVLNLSSIITGWADHLREFACVVRCDPRIRWKRVRGRTALLWEVECLQNVFSTYDWPISQRCFLVGLETKSMRRNSLFEHTE